VRTVSTHAQRYARRSHTVEQVWRRELGVARRFSLTVRLLRVSLLWSSSGARCLLWQGSSCPSVPRRVLVVTAAPLTHDGRTVGSDRRDHGAAMMVPVIVAATMSCWRSRERW
jgi:hypothetical protein